MAERLVDVIRQLATREEGFTTSDKLLEPFGPRSQIGRDMAHLVRRGEIVVVRLSARRVVMFGRREWADAWMLRTNHQPWNRSKSYSSVAELQHRAPLRDEVIVPADVRITRCPGFEPRFQSMVPAGVLPRVYHGAVGRVQ